MDENIDQARSYYPKEIKQNKLLSKKHRKVCRTLNYIAQFLILASTIIVFHFLRLLLCLVFL